MLEVNFIKNINTSFLTEITDKSDVVVSIALNKNPQVSPKTTNSFQAIITVEGSRGEFEYDYFKSNSILEAKEYINQIREFLQSFGFPHVLTNTDIKVVRESVPF